MSSTNELRAGVAVPELSSFAAIGDGRSTMCPSLLLDALRPLFASLKFSCTPWGTAADLMFALLQFLQDSRGYSQRRRHRVSQLACLVGRVLRQSANLSRGLRQFSYDFRILLRRIRQRLHKTEKRSDGHKRAATSRKGFMQRSRST